jgi:PAS domain S-box-containing protein
MTTPQDNQNNSPFEWLKGFPLVEYFQKKWEERQELPAPTRHFTERYILALLVTAGLFFVSYRLLMSTLDKQSHYFAQINIIGKQNTLSQEIAKKVLIIRTCEKEKICRQELTSLQEILYVFEKSQKILLNGDDLLTREGMRNKKIDSLHRQNRYHFNPILEASRALIKLKTSELDAFKTGKIDPTIKNKIIINTQKILYKEQTFTGLLSNMAFEYNKEAQSYIHRIQWYEGILLFIGFALLAIEAFFLFPPIVRKLKEFVRELRQTHAEAEEKTQKATQAYQQLKVVEEVTRLNAEALKKTNENLLKTQEKLTLAHTELTEKNKKLEESYDLINTHKQIEEVQFFDSSIRQFSEIMRWQANQTIYSWSDNLLEHLVPFVDGMQGVLYVYDSEKNSLFVIGSYATEQHSILQFSEVELGENLVGQVAKSMKTIYFPYLNGQAKEFSTHSGTQEVLPQSLLVLPLVYNNSIAGVLELTSTKKMADKHLDLLKKLSESIGTHLSTLQDQKRINQHFADLQMAQKRLKKSLNKIKENEERFRKLSEVTQEGLLFLNDNIIKDTNSILIKMLGYERIEELLNTHYINLIAPKYRFEIEEKKILTDGFTHETIAVRKNGESFPIEIQFRNVSYDNELMTVISIRDITEKKRTEKQLEEANRIASLVTELEKKNKDITASIEYAQRIQEAILPSDKLLGKGFLEHFVLYMPKDIVSGDFYWYAEKNEHSLIAAVDCTGHGVPGAFMSIIGSSNLNKIVIEQGITDPATILTELDKEVTQILKQREGNSQSRDGMDIALCSLNIFEKKLTFAGAMRPMYLFQKGELLEFKGSPFPIGGSFKFKKEKTYTTYEMYLDEGDTLYIFSDGFPDQCGGPENRKYMSKQFKEFLLRLQPQNLETQQELIHQEFLNWKGNYKQMDDVLVIGLRF